MKKLNGCLKNYIWGGYKLKNFYGKAPDMAAESWEVSIHPDGQCMAGDETLALYLQQNPYAVDKLGSGLPILIKYIDAAKNLSVQVHPNDEYARLNENDNGKTEMWYVIQADKGAGIYCGFRRDTSKEEFLRKLAEGTVEQLLNFIPVQSGDCYLIKAGTVHAIGAGCFICEVQQSSNVTYRVYDYNRLGADGKPRALHVDKAVNVINFKAFHDETESKLLLNTSAKARLLTECEYFSCREITFNGAYTETNVNSFTALNVIRGSGTVNGQPFTSGDSFFMDCGEGFQMNGEAVVLLTNK